MKFDGAIFDMDGTLLDSMPAWQDIGERYLRSIGIVPDADISDKLREMRLFEAAGYVNERYSLGKDSMQIIREINSMLEDFYFNRAELKPGVINLLDCLECLGVKMCIATATESYLAAAALKRNGIFKYFSKIFTCGELGISKNHPDIYLRAAEFMGTEIRNTLVFEDAFHAVKTASEAGFTVAAVYDRSSESHRDEIMCISDFYLERIDSFTDFIDALK